MKICFVVPFRAPELGPPRTYLARTVLHQALPARLAAAGHDVHVLVLADREERFPLDDVRYAFLPAPLPARLLAAAAGRLSRRSPAYFELATPLANAVRHLAPDVVHLHGTHLHLNVAWLHARLGGRWPIILHYHGGFVPRAGWKRRLLRHNLSRASGVCFTTGAQEQAFRAAGLLPSHVRTLQVVETSSTFRLLSRDEARHRTGLKGHPVMLSTGRLDPVKDPLTVLRGVEDVFTAWPDAHFYLYYRSDRLLSTLQQHVNASPVLYGRVHFMGEANHTDMELIYNSADVLLQGSRHEFSGCAVLEAMACGVLPAVTDIPSFRYMTAGGTCGILFPPGDAAALRDGLLGLDLDAIPTRPIAVRRRFEEALSFDAMATALQPFYEEVCRA